MLIVGLHVCAVPARCRGGGGVPCAFVLQEAKTLELDNTKTRQAEAVVDRGRIVQETVDKLTRACAKFDLDALNEVGLHLNLHNVALSCA